MIKDRYNKRIPLNQDILAKIAKIDEFKGLWQGGLRLSPQILGRLKSGVIISSTSSSTRIEGVKMADEEIARFLRGLKTKKPKNRDEEEVAGYANLIGRIFDNWKTIKLSENWILQFHDILLNFSKKDQAHKGKYKNSANTVVVINENNEQIVLFDPSPPHLVQAEMQAVIEWANDELKAGSTHPLLAIANFIFEFLAIHPFKDGNGRVSRALTNLLLLKAGYAYIPYVSLDEIIEQSRDKYYLALRTTQKNHKTDQENIVPWINYLLDVLLIQAKKAKDLMEFNQPEKLLSVKQTQIYYLFEGDKEMGVAEISRLLKGGIPHSTIKQALSRLVTLKLLKRIGQGRGTRYIKY